MRKIISGGLIMDKSLSKPYLVIYEARGGVRHILEIVDTTDKAILNSLADKLTNHNKTKNNDSDTYIETLHIGTKQQLQYEFPLEQANVESWATKINLG